MLDRLQVVLMRLNKSLDQPGGLPRPLLLGRCLRSGLRLAFGLAAPFPARLKGPLIPDP
jgi:hypothetical protein